jgi:CRISPR-associated endonuclease/helicase Cas3
MEFYSHARINENQQKEGSKKLKEHLSNVSRIAAQNRYPRVHFQWSEEQISSLIQNICKLHDLGKYTSFFQNYLLNREKVSPDMKKHSRLGAYYLVNRYSLEQLKLALFSYLCVVSHHGNLTNIKESEFFGENGKEIYQKRFDKQKADLKEKAEHIRNDLEIEDLYEWLHFPDYSFFRKSIRKVLKRETNIEDYFFVNYIFSLLTEADKLDASETPIYKKQTLNDQAVEQLIPSANLSDLPSLGKIRKQNDLRNLARAKVLENLNDPDILTYRLFTLTAPTGIGKTLTSLDFALKLKTKLREEKDHEAQIIYGLPFINIIEQAFNVYSNQVFHDDIKNENIKILAHYQYADVFGNRKDDEKSGYHQKMMQLDTWQSDIVITSFVQFFETLISNRNKLLKKFHHFAGSIIILDEVQTLKLDLMPLIGATLYYLTKYLDARVIMMTATQPKIFDLAQSIILEKEGEKIQTKELLNNHERIFKKFERTKIIPLVDKEIDNNNFLALFQDYWKENNSCLIVCNTVQRSLDIYRSITSMNLQTPVYYLSTNIVPAKRKSIIRDIGKDLNEQKNPILITTQVIEAGVDLDFDLGFRDIGPVDSLVQVAGRINRENNEKRKNSPLYIVKFLDQKGTSDAAKVYGDLTYHQAIKVLTRENEILEKDYKKLVESYFSELSEKKAFDLSQNIFHSMKVLKYDGEKDEYPVSSFKIIDQAPWAMSVYIEIDEKAIEARQAFESLLNHKMSKEMFDQKYKLEFNQHIIAVPDYLPKLKELKEDQSNYLSENILLVRNELLDDYYSTLTGFRRDKIEETDKVEML